MNNGKIIMKCCDRCLSDGKQEYAQHSVGSLFGYVLEEDLCEKHLKIWKKENSKKKDKQM